jgi:hypothetical protein
VFATTDSGTVLDCEQGNCTPAQSVDWVLLRRKAGVDPTVYCGRNTWWGQIRAAFQARNVPEPHYWVADYSGDPAKPAIPPGAIALQYEDAGPYDLSAVADYWPGVDPPEGADMPLTEADITAVAQAVMDKVTNVQRGVVTTPHTGGGTSTVGSEILALPTRFDALTATLASLGAKVGALAAPVDVKTLAASVVAALTPIVQQAVAAGAAPDYDHMAAVLEAHLAATFAQGK